MSKAFKKGQEVTYIGNFDRKGTFMFRNAVVYSCGTKQMVLTDAVSGKEMGRHYKPQMGNEHGGTFPRMTNAEAIAKCEELAELFLNDYREFLEWASSPESAAKNGQGYANEMARKITELKAPTGINYHEHYAAR